MPSRQTPPPPVPVWQGRPSGEAFADMLRRRAEHAGIVVEVEVQAWSLPGSYGVSADWVGEPSNEGFFCEVADWVNGVRILDAGDDDASVPKALDYFGVRLTGAPVQEAMHTSGVRRKSWFRRWRERRSDDR